MTTTWQKILRKNFTDWERLADFVELKPEDRLKIDPDPNFILNLPLRLAEKIEKGKINDPILRQFLPLKEEKIFHQEFSEDPVSDAVFRRGKKLLQKYKGRVLLVMTGACAMHCRYCFRKNFSYESRVKQFEEELIYISEDSSIEEVILSGGDPLSLPNTVIEQFLFSISKIPHVKRIRFHTRFPVGIPERIDEDFLKLIDHIPQRIWLILHINHPREIDQDLLDAMFKLQKKGVNVLNQAVLLKGVNDQKEILIELFKKLVNHNIIPYYLHQLDKVQGASHFEVKEERGKKLLSQIMEELPGYAVPKYAKELAGKPSKTVII